MYNTHPHQQRQQPKLPSLHHLMLPSPPLNYHSKQLPQPPSSSHSCPMSTVSNTTPNRYSRMPPRAPRMESYEYIAPLKSIQSDYQVLDDASFLLFGTRHSNTIPYQPTSTLTPPSSLYTRSSTSTSSSAAPFQDFVLFEPLDQRHSSSSSSSSSLSPSCRGKLIPDLNASSSLY